MAVAVAVAVNRDGVWLERSHVGSHVGSAGSKIQNHLTQRTEIVVVLHGDATRAWIDAGSSVL